jgi:hypothetical protein
MENTVGHVDALDELSGRIVHFTGGDEDVDDLLLNSRDQDYCQRLTARQNQIFADAKTIEGILSGCGFEKRTYCNDSSKVIVAYVKKDETTKVICDQNLLKSEWEICSYSVPEGRFHEFESALPRWYGHEVQNPMKEERYRMVCVGGVCGLLSFGIVSLAGSCSTKDGLILSAAFGLSSALLSYFNNMQLCRTKVIRYERERELFRTARDDDAPWNSDLSRIIRGA